MPWIRMIDENVATGGLEEVYGDIKVKHGKIADIMKIRSLNPSAIHIHMELCLSFTPCPSGIGRAERELIGVVVSVDTGYI